MTAICTVAGCAERARARGWCNTHYRRWQRHGETQAHLPIRGTASAGEVSGIDAQRVVALYRQGVSGRTIAGQLGVGRTAIHQLLHRHQVPIRRPGQKPSTDNTDQLNRTDLRANDSTDSSTDRSPARTQRPTTPRHPDPQGAPAAADGRTQSC